MEAEAGREMEKKSSPNVGLCLRPAMGASLEGKGGDLKGVLVGNQVDALSGRGASPFVPSLCTVCHPLPHPRLLGLGPSSPPPAPNTLP